MDMRPRFGASVTILGHVLLTVGICLVLQPTWGDLALAGLFGALVAVLKRVGGRWTSVQMIMPVAAAFAVSAITFLLAGQGWAEADLRAMIAPLVTFLPQGQRPHPVIGFSEVQLTEQTLADYTDTLAYLGATIRLYRDTFRRLGLLGGQGQGEGQDGNGKQPTEKTGERFKVACGCQPSRSFWIRAKQYTPGPITCGVCGQDFQPQDAARRTAAGHPETPTHSQVA
jgi:threonine/serine exporter ThrE